MYTDQRNDTTYLLGVLYKGAGSGWRENINGSVVFIQTPKIFSRVVDPDIFKWLHGFDLV